MIANYVKQLHNIEWTQEKYHEIIKSLLFAKKACHLSVNHIYILFIMSRTARA